MGKKKKILVPADSGIAGLYTTPVESPKLEPWEIAMGAGGLIVSVPIILAIVSIILRGSYEIIKWAVSF